MKQLLIFIFFLCIGISISIGYKLFLAKQVNKQHTFHTAFGNAPTQSIQGNMISYSGDVQWQSRTANQPVALTQTQPIQQGEQLSTGKDGNVTIEFPNIAKISISPNTLINIIQTLPENIVLQQPSGSTEYTKEGTIPVSIRSFNLLTNIQNGTALITIDKQADTITTTVKQGSVLAAFNDSQRNSNVVTVNHDQSFVYHIDTQEGSIE